MSKGLMAFVFLGVFFALCYLAFVRVDSSERWKIKEAFDTQQTELTTLRQEFDTYKKLAETWKVEAERRILQIAPDKAEQVNAVFAIEKFEETPSPESKTESLIEAASE